jgi:hypothetical protein
MKQARLASAILFSVLCVVELSHAKEVSRDTISLKDTHIFLELLEEAMRVYPSDSTLLRSFYIKQMKSEPNERKIIRLNSLLSPETQRQYHEISKNLMPLLRRIAMTKSPAKLTKREMKDLLNLYSNYDHLAGEALRHSISPTEDENKLSWKAFQRLSIASKTDTLYIYTLIELENHIRTNVELAEAMNCFVMEAIRNNPEGFLKMYVKRNHDSREYWSHYIVYDQCHGNLLNLFSHISESSKSDTIRKAAHEVLELSARFPYER